MADPSDATSWFHDAIFKADLGGLTDQSAEISRVNLKLVYRRCDFRGGKKCSHHLIQRRLEDVVIAGVDQDDAHVRAA